MKTFNTLQEIFDKCKEVQNVQQILNRRLMLKKTGWTTVKISSSLIEEITKEVCEKLGGWPSTKIAINKNLKSNKPPQHWGLARFLIEDNGDGARIDYCTGQCQLEEHKEIRNYLKK